jgi:hypothetical protein
MGALDGLWHLMNFLAPAVGVSTIAALLAKLLWRRELKGVPVWRLVAFAAGASAIVLVVGLAWTGQDGKMATYGAMVLACALGLWWSGWRAKR